MAESKKVQKSISRCLGFRRKTNKTVALMRFPLRRMLKQWNKVTAGRFSALKLWEFQEFSDMKKPNSMRETEDSAHLPFLK